jgi:hypothetical protein
MRIGEYLPWIIATFSTLIFVTTVSPKHWSENTKRAFSVAIAGAFFFLIGAYWLTTGEKLDESAYRLILCKLYPFERCSSVSSEVAPKGDVPDQLKQQMAALTKTANELKRQQEEMREAKRREEDRAAAKSKTDAQEDTLRKQEETGDIALQNARQYWGQGNFKVAGAYSEEAIKHWSSLPNANAPEIQDKIAAAHSIVGLGLAILGATPKDQAYGCGRLDTARQIYQKTHNTPMAMKVDQEKHLGKCS